MEREKSEPEREEMETASRFLSGLTDRKNMVTGLRSMHQDHRGGAGEMVQ